MEEAASLAIREIRTLNDEFAIPHDLREFHIPAEEHDLLVQRSMGSSMSGNLDVSTTEAHEILKSLV